MTSGGGSGSSAQASLGGVRAELPCGAQSKIHAPHVNTRDTTGIAAAA